jgi:class 3 adenylate cyclase
VHEERKVVTVLFCDLVGFTAASDAADPEDVRARMLPYYAACARRSSATGGRSKKFIGDAVMAVFGAWRGGAALARVRQRARKRQALLGRGRCLAALARADAEEPLREARELFASMGHKPALAEAEALLGEGEAAAV